MRNGGGRSESYVIKNVTQRDLKRFRSAVRISHYNFFFLKCSRSKIYDAAWDLAVLVIDGR